MSVTQAAAQRGTAKALLFGLALLGCSSEPSSKYIEWPDEIDVAFVVRLEAGRLVEIQGPLSGEQGVMSELPARETLFFIGWSLADLEALDRSFDATRLAEISLVPEAETCVSGHTFPSDRLRQWPMPSRTRVFSLPPDGLSLEPSDALPFELLSLRLPIGGVCGRAFEGKLIPFVGDGHVFPDGASVGGHNPFVESAYGELIEMVRLDADRIIGRARYGLYLFDRRTTWSDTPAQSLLLNSNGFPVIAALPGSAPGTQRVFTTALEGQQLRLVEVELTDRGFGDPQFGVGLQTAEAIVRDGDRFLLLTDDSVFTGTTAAQIEELVQLPGRAIRALHIREGPLPHVMVGRGGLTIQADLYATPPTVVEHPLGTGSDIGVDLYSISSWRDELWAGSSAAGVFTSADGIAWANPPLSPDAGPGTCLDPPDGCGLRRLARDLFPTPSDRNLFLGTQRCSSMFVLLDEGCVVWLDVSDEVPDPNMLSFGPIDVGAGFVTVASVGGIILELEPAAP